MLESERSPAEQCADVMERIAAQAERAGEVIRQIRHFVRKGEPESRPVAVQDIVRNVIELIRHDARRDDVQIQLELGKQPDRVMAQQIQIEQVVLNLARNAIEAMSETAPDRRRLTISTAHAAEGRTEVRVSDTGPGISPIIADSLFTPFATTKPQGMGLGLSISHGIISAHGGRLTVTSTPGEGASFSFSLNKAIKKGDEQNNSSSASGTPAMRDQAI